MHICRTALSACLGLAVLLVVSAPAQAQYRATTLVSNQIDEHAPTTDPLLVNAWGFARSATSPWWISDNLSGWSTLYNEAGTKVPLTVLIPTAGNGPTEAAGLNGPGTPTGIVYNGSKTEFEVQGMPSPFIFATIDGTISAWAPGVNANQAILEVDNSASKASYTGLAISSNPSGPNFLYATDNTNNHVDMFNGSFQLVKSFTDPNIPSNFSVFGIQDINGQVYVAYAVPITPAQAVAGVGAGGFIDVFKEDGTFVKTLVKGLPLNQAWGMTLAPSNFGPLSNTLLVSNNADFGTINAFNPQTGAFVDVLRDRHGRPMIFNNTWAVGFGGGNTTNGATNELFVTVGPGNGAQSEMAGTFLSIVFDPRHDQGDQNSQH